MHILEFVQAYKTKSNTNACRWDFCFDSGTVVEHLDGHTDIIQMQLYRHWLPWFNSYSIKQSKLTTRYKIVNASYNSGG